MAAVPKLLHMDGTATAAAESGSSSAEIATVATMAVEPGAV